MQQPPEYPPYYGSQKLRPKKKGGPLAYVGRIALVIGILIILMMIVTIIRLTDPATYPVSSGTPTAWGTTHSFSGNGNGDTKKFTVGNNWQITWSCIPSSSALGSYSITVNVLSTDRIADDPGAISATCEDGNISGDTQEHQGGTVYLDVVSSGAWMVTIQEPE